MRIAIASDHAGFDMKADLAAWLRDEGLDVLDLVLRDDVALLDVDAVRRNPAEDSR